MIKFVGYREKKFVLMEIVIVVASSRKTNETLLVILSSTFKTALKYRVDLSDTFNFFYQKRTL